MCDDLCMWMGISDESVKLSSAALRPFGEEEEVDKKKQKSQVTAGGRPCYDHGTIL